MDLQGGVSANTNMRSKVKSTLNDVDFDTQETPIYPRYHTNLKPRIDIRIDHDALDS